VARGQGIGSDLLRQAQAAAPALTLWTFQANTGAQRFYLRHGFREALRTQGEANDEGLPDIRYEWQQEAR
jgi:ribosomal protein S18 acetylase RimI-like enzyme